MPRAHRSAPLPPSLRPAPPGPAPPPLVRHGSAPPCPALPCSAPPVGCPSFGYDKWFNTFCASAETCGHRANRNCAHWVSRCGVRQVNISNNTLASSAAVLQWFVSGDLTKTQRSEGYLGNSQLARETCKYLLCFS